MTPSTDELRERFMREAIALAEASVRAGGGPFGAVVVRGDEVIGRGHNRVALDCDPTAHAEIVAIRDAARRLGDFSLAGCEIYINCEPCPMCLAAIYWARLDALYYGASAADAAAIGFDDALIAREVCLPQEARQVSAMQLLAEEGRAPFRLWMELPERVEY